MRNFLTLATTMLVLLPLAAFAPEADATHYCGGRGTVISAGGVHIAFDGVLPHGAIASVWIYLESNGRSGLQRGGITLLGDMDVCQDSAVPDLGVF